MDESEALVKKRLAELANKAYMSGRYCFTNFLSLAEQNVYHSMEKEISHIPSEMFGGTNDCERLMIRFGDETLCGYDEPFPIVCVEIIPNSGKFCEELSHRDYLGALMNLGIDRAMLGDIVISKSADEGSKAYLFCVERMSSYIMDELIKVRHTNVHCAIAKNIPASAVARLERRTVQVNSERIDGIIAHLYHLSRSESDELFKAGKVFINGRQCVSASARLNIDDKVSVRGFGRFCFVGISGETRKGRLNTEVDMYYS